MFLPSILWLLWLLLQVSTSWLWLSGVTFLPIFQGGILSCNIGSLMDPWKALIFSMFTFSYCKGRRDDFQALYVLELKPEVLLMSLLVWRFFSWNLYMYLLQWEWWSANYYMLRCRIPISPLPLYKLFSASTVLESCVIENNSNHYFFNSTKDAT